MRARGGVYRRHMGSWVITRKPNPRRLDIAAEVDIEEDQLSPLDMIVAPSVLCQFPGEPPTRRQRGRAPFSVGVIASVRSLRGEGWGVRAGACILRKNPPTRTQWLTRYVPVFRYQVAYLCTGFPVRLCRFLYRDSGEKISQNTVRSCTGIPVRDSVFCDVVGLRLLNRIPSHLRKSRVGGSFM